jgi:Sec-independent protein translocase protein TatA
MMNFWFPVVFGTFKLLVLGTGMFLAIKSHRDGARKEREEREKEKEMKAT